MKKIFVILVMLVVLGTMSMTANAATSTDDGILDLVMTITSPTTFQVYASMGTFLGDRGSFGIVSANFDISGWTTIVNELPFAGKKVGKVTYGLGFTLLTSPDGETPVTGSLDTVTSGVPIVYGIGQIPIDLFADFGATVGGWNESFGAPVLVASGTFNDVLMTDLASDVVYPKIEWGDFNYFTDEAGNNTSAQVRITNYTPPTPTVPEPSSMIVLGSGAVALLGFIRRKRS